MKFNYHPPCQHRIQNTYMFACSMTRNKKCNILIKLENLMQIQIYLKYYLPNSPPTKTDTHSQINIIIIFS